MKRNINNPEKFIGKKINLNKWNLPEGYNVCEKTRKFYAESDLGVTFAHHTFDRNWLIEKHIYIEDAAWLSAEGYDEIMDVLKREGKYSEYLERAA